jgi:hypothetical protein
MMINRATNDSISDEPEPTDQVSAQLFKSNKAYEKTGRYPAMDVLKT